MKKKLLVLLLIIAVAAFVFAGCTPGAEGEGEGEGEIEGIEVEIEGQYEKDGRIYVRGGAPSDITVTFPAPVTGVVQVDLTDCTGNYSKGGIALFPNADRTVWEGSIYFDCHYWTLPSPCDTRCEQLGNDCCATTITIISGACDRDTCTVFPVIVDCAPPTASLCVEAACCACEGIDLTFKTTKTTGVCAPDEEDCYDDCSGIGGWSIDIFCGNPFDKCCEVPCAEPIFSASGTDCPINVTTSCLDCKSPMVPLHPGTNEMRLFAIFSIWDNVGNTIEVGKFITVYYVLDDDFNCLGIESIVETCDGIKEDPNGKPCIDCWTDLKVCSTQKYYTAP